MQPDLGPERKGSQDGQTEGPEQGHAEPRDRHGATGAPARTGRCGLFASIVAAARVAEMSLTGESAARAPFRTAVAAMPQISREIIIFLISAMAFAGFSPFGQVLAQFMIVWQR